MTIPTIVLAAGLIERLLSPFWGLVEDAITLDPILGQLIVLGLLLGGVYALTAIGLTMIFGVMDVVNFAHGAFIVVGAYTVWVATSALGLNPFLAIPLSILVLFVLGTLVYLGTISPILEAPQQNQLIVTFGVAIIIQSLLEIQFKPDPRRVQIDLATSEVFGIAVPHGRLIALVIALVVIVAAWLFLFRTDLGRRIRATSNNRNGGRYVGINVPRINLVTFGIGAILAGLAGASLTLFQNIDPYLGDRYLINAFVVVVLGGLGSFPGALLGGMVIGFIDVFGGFYLPGTTSQVLIFLVFFVMLLVKPEGLLGGTGQ